MNSRVLSYTHILGLILGLGALSSFPIYHLTMRHQTPQLKLFGAAPSQEAVAQVVEKLAHQGVTVADTITEDLNTQHAQLVAAIQPAFSIPSSQWQEMRQQFEQRIKNDDLLEQNPQVVHGAQDHELVKLARELLAEYGINPKRVTIYTISEPNSLTNAAAEQAYFKNQVLHRISINVPCLSKRPRDTQEAILRHEIQHLLNYDPLELQCIDDLLEKNGKSDYIKHPAYVALNKHKEYRADLTAACDSIEIARAFKKNFDINIAQNPALQNDTSYWVTHPSSKQRQQAVDQLLSYLNAENQITTLA